MKTKTENIIGSTAIKPADHATLAFRIVLRFLGAHASTPYVTHMETFKADGTHDGFNHGDYCADMLEGYESLKRRALHYGLAVFDANGKRIPARTL